VSIEKVLTVGIFEVIGFTLVKYIRTPKAVLISMQGPNCEVVAKERIDLRPAKPLLKRNYKK
jgi:hypothetical protein